MRLLISEYPLSRNRFWHGCLSLTHSFEVNAYKLKTTKFSLKKHRSIARRNMRFDILNRLGVDDECDRRTDGQRDRTTVSNSAVYRHVLKGFPVSKYWMILKVSVSRAPFGLSAHPWMVQHLCFLKQSLFYAVHTQAVNAANCSECMQIWANYNDRKQSTVWWHGLLKLMAAYAASPNDGDTRCSGC